MVNADSNNKTPAFNFSVIPLLFAMTLALAACGGSNNESGPVSATPVTSETSPASSTTAPGLANAASDSDKNAENQISSETPQAPTTNIDAPSNNPTPTPPREPVPQSTPDVVTAFTPESGADQTVVIEAENFTTTTMVGEHQWQLVSRNDASATVAMQAIPNAGLNTGENDPNAGPRLDYLVNFVEPGTYYIWVLGAADGPDDDSVNVGLNGTMLESADRLSYVGVTPTWTNRRMNNAPARIDVPTTGAHQLNVWMREDGFVLDKILLTKNSAFTPKDGGPSQSAKAQAIAATPTITPPGATITNTVEVSITSTTPESTIFFTTDDSDPATNGITYSGPIIVSSATTVRAIATAPNYATSGEALAGFSFGTCEPVRIMPVGDSVTLGSGTTSTEGDFVGYRRKLHSDLTNLGFNVDFVGSEDNGSGATTGSDFDTQHEGHGGWRADEVATTIHDWLVANPAQVVLLHIGTNDIAKNPQDTSVDDVESILNEIDRFDPNVAVVLARIINQLNNNNQPRFTVNQYNNNLQTLADQRIAAGDKIIVVDMETAIDYTADLADYLHPNITGYNKMATRWKEGLTSFMPKCATRP